MIKEILRKVHFTIYGNGETFLDIEMDPFLEGLIEDVLHGREDARDLQKLTVQWYLEQAEEEVINKDYWSTSEAADDAVLALATRLGWKTVPPPILRLDFVRELAKKLGDPEIPRLYEVATDLYGLPDEERAKVSEKLLDRIKRILSVLPSNGEKEKIAW